MRGLGGFVLLAAGLGVAAYAYYPGAPLLDARSWREAKAPSQDTVVTETASQSAPRARLFSPQTPLFSPGTTVSVAMAPTAVAREAAQPSSATAPVQPWSTVVQTVAVPQGEKLTSSKPGTIEARADLVREIQKELKRVGCYEGDVDGSWGGGSKRAMAAFTDRVNATLPTEEPDYILLTLLQGHRNAACGAACPTGQVMTDNRCVPKAVVAQAPRKPVKQDVRTAPATQSRDDAERSVGPAAVATAAVVAAKAVERVVVSEAPLKAEPPRALTKDKEPDGQTTGQVAPPARAAATPAKVTPAPVVAAAQAVPASPVEPLPGRMTIGGPIAAEQPRQTAKSAATEAPAPHKAPAPRVNAAPKPARVASTQHHDARPAAPVRVVPPVRVAPAPSHSPPPRRDPRPTRFVAAPSVSAPPGGTKQRAMIYNLFQRPDRASN